MHAVLIRVHKTFIFKEPSSFDYSTSLQLNQDNKPTLFLLLKLNLWPPEDSDEGVGAGCEDDIESSEVLRTTAYFSINSTLFISRGRPKVTKIIKVFS
jgi:hypothetical protein